jgi:hypothetical protein
MNPYQDWLKKKGTDSHTTQSTTPFDGDSAYRRNNTSDGALVAKNKDQANDSV